MAKKNKANIKPSTLWSYIILGGFILSLLYYNLISLPHYRQWGVFHYYVGAKYLKELGYFNLYNCAVESGNSAWEKIRIVRDLRSYKLLSDDKIPKCPNENFSEDRLKKFREDVSLITAKEYPQYWAEVATDKGFNPPPSWAAIAGPIAYSFSPENEFISSIIFNLDVVFIIIAGVVVFLISGPLAALITLVLALLYFGTFGIIGNNFLQYAWFPALCASIAFHKKGRFGSSGITLGIASALQVFPAVFLIPIAVSSVLALLKKDFTNFKKNIFFLFSFFCTVILFALMGILHTGKTGIWFEWYEKITTHRNYINGEVFNIGLPNLITEFGASDRSNSFSYTEAYDTTIARGGIFSENLTIWLIIITIYFTISVIALRRNVNPFVIGFIPMYLLMSLSPFYYLSLSLIPFALWENKKLRIASIVSLLCLYILNLVLIYPRMYYISFNYNMHLISELSVFGFFKVLLFLIPSNSLQEKLD